MTALVHREILIPATYGRQHKKPVKGLYNSMHTWYASGTCCHLDGHMPPTTCYRNQYPPLTSSVSFQSAFPRSTANSVNRGLHLAFNRLGHGAWSWSHGCGCSRSFQASSGHVWSCLKDHTKAMIIHKRSMQEITRCRISRFFFANHVKQRGIVIKPSYKRNDKKMYWIQLNLCKKKVLLWWPEPSKNM